MNIIYKLIRNKHNIAIILFFTFFISSFFFNKIPIINSLSLILILLLSILCSNKKRLFKVFKNPIIIFLFIYSLYMLFDTIFISINKERAFQLWHIRLPIILLTFAYLLLNFNYNIQLKIVYTYISTIFIGFLFALLNATFKYFNNIENIFYSDSLVECLSTQATAFSIHITFIILFILYNLKKINFNKLNILLIILLLIFVIANMILLAKFSIFITILSCSVFILYLFYNNQWKIATTTIIIIILFTSLCSNSFNNIINRFRDFKQMQKSNIADDSNEIHFSENDFDTSRWNTVNYRMSLIKLGLNLCKDNLLIGVGLGDADSILLNKYKKENLLLAVKRKNRLHNGYLTAQLEMGIIGFLLYILAFVIIPFYNFFKNKNYIGLLFLLVFAVYLSLDNWMDVMRGQLTISSIFVVFLLLKNRK